MKKRIFDLSQSELGAICERQDTPCITLYPNLPEEKAFRYKNKECPLHCDAERDCPARLGGLLNLIHACFDSIDELIAYLNKEADVPDNGEKAK